MLINEVTKQVDLSKRAIKYYEEKGLLSVTKDENGYRNYTEADVRCLKEISAYRKLGIGLGDIKKLLSGQDQELLKRIYKQKQQDLHTEQNELAALEAFLETQNVEALYTSVNYKTIAQAITDAIPGFYGYYFLNHFMRYLQMPITTPEQQEAYEAIVEFWDTVELKIPLFQRLISFVMGCFAPKITAEKLVELRDRELGKYINYTEDEYAKLKEQTRQNVKLKNSILFKYHPAQISQRKFMKALQDCGYNDIFIANMKKLSPQYREYREALQAINDRICADLGLYYDSDYNLVMKH